MSADIPAPALRPCPVCHAPAAIDHETRALPCGHVGFLTRAGVVVGWVNTADCALNLERVLTSWESAPLAGGRHAACLPSGVEALEVGRVR